MRIKVYEMTSLRSIFCIRLIRLYTRQQKLFKGHLEVLYNFLDFDIACSF